MPQPEVTFSATSLTSEQRDTFTSDAKLAYGTLDKIRNELEVPASDLRLIVTDDFAASVRAHQRKPEEPFSPERPFGIVAAKNLPQDDEWERVVIVFHAATWSGHVAGQDRFHALGLICHELAHPILERQRRAAGVLKGADRSCTPTEFARSISRIGYDEYCADSMADIFLARTMSKTVDGVTSPAITWDLDGPALVDGLRELLSRLHPLLPDAVQTYREWRSTLDQLWAEIIRQTEGVVTGFAHARAHADAVDPPPPLLNADEIRDLPFVRLFLRDTMPPYLDAMRTGALLVPVGEFAEVDARVVAAGERMLKEIWRRLGLTFTEVDGQRQFEIHVGEPLR
jgi:hypothetical protein